MLSALQHVVQRFNMLSRDVGAAVCVVLDGCASDLVRRCRLRNGDHRLDRLALHILRVLLPPSYAVRSSLPVLPQWAPLHPSARTASGRRILSAVRLALLGCAAAGGGAHEFGKACAQVVPVSLELQAVREGTRWAVPGQCRAGPVPGLNIADRPESRHSKGYS